MRSQRDYYEILGILPTASSDEIKKRYRELARKFHPDVAKDKAVGHRAFTQIIEAYRTLSDPEKRRAYDASRTPPPPPGPARSSSGSSRPSPGPGQTRTYSSRPSSARPTPPPRERSATDDRLVNEAMYAFNTRRLQQAMNICRQAIRQNRENAKAHAILADIYRIQGKKDQAVLEYGYAIQYDPTDRDSVEKLDKLLGPKNRQKAASERARQRQRSPEEYADEIRSAANVANIVGWGICFFLLFLINAYPGKPIQQTVQYLPGISSWSWNLVGILCADAALIGFLMAVNKIVDHPDEELFFQYLPGAMIPIGIPIMIFSFIQFYITAGTTLVMNYIQGQSSKSLVRVFIAVTVLTLAAALVYPAGRAQVAISGANIAFPAAVIGWYFGSLFAPIQR